MMKKEYNTERFVIDNKFLPFIVLEGPDGVGKTTQAALLLQKMPSIAKSVNDKLKEYVKTVCYNLNYNIDRLILVTDTYKPIKAPDYSYPEGRAIKHGLFNGFTSEVDRNILYIKDRVNTSKRIIQAVSEGCTAGYISDRWSLSQYVYEIQLGVTPKSALALVYEYEYGCHDMVSPDFTIILKGEADTLLKRMSSQREANLDRNEKDTDGQRKRIQLYEDITDADEEVALYPEALETVCGSLYRVNINTLSVEEVHLEITKLVESKLLSLMKSINNV